GPGNAPGVWRRHQRPGFHARPPVLYRTLAAGVGMTGLGWPRLAAVVAEQIPPAEVDGVWVFPTVRHEGREWGTAVLSRADGERRRIYTARYMLAIKG